MDMVSVEAAVDVIKTSVSNALLKTLTLAALSLPGVAVKAEVTEAEYVDLNTQFSRYAESGNRMKVDVYQASALLPLTDKLDFKVNGVKDIVTGASPVFYDRVHGKPHMQLSGASIQDVRDSVDMTGSYQHDKGTFAVGVGRSSENDYLSNFFNINSRWDFNKKNTTLETGYGFSSDTVWAIDHCPPHCLGGLSGLSSGNSANTTGTYKRQDVGGDKSTHQGLLGLTHILDKNSLLQTNLTYTYNEGYLSDPYKVVYTPWITKPYPGYSDSGGYSHDTRPTSRHQIAMLTRYVRHFSALNSAALHLDYRFYADSWGIHANTFEINWIQPVWQGWQISPKIRHYSQSSSDFYQPYFLTPNTEGFYTSDYRLAQFGAISGGLQLNKEFFNRLNLGFGVDFYQRKQDLGFNGGIGNRVDNFTFSMFTAKINLKF